ncbi:MFS transporter [Nocardiopsis sp. LOL_012]|uniref:MFS transporter n=1 Tax=Nocardiopsis sp. LOL_012 TaxID=3345409 RepID=UPI003A85AC7B
MTSPQITPSPTADPLPRRRVLGFAVGSVGNGVFGAVPGLLLLFYLTEVMAVPAAAAGAVIVAAKVWDAVCNPVVGLLSDREAVRTGRRTRLLLVGALGLPLLFTALFTSPFSSPTAALVWTGLMFVLAATAYSCFQVPYIALAAELSPRQDQRARAISWRIVFLTVGILAAGGLATVVVDAFGGGRAGHTAMGLTMGALMCATMLVTALSTRWVPSRPGERVLGPLAALRAARGNRPFFALLTGFALQAMAIAVMLAGAPYVAVYRLGDYSLTTVMFACVVGPSMLCVPLWAAAARRFGTVPCYLAALLAVTAACAALFPAATAASAVSVFALLAVVGVGYAALQLLPLSLLPETVRADAVRTGQAQSGAFTGVWTAAETGAMALGPGLFSVVLAATAFVSGNVETEVAQPASAVAGLTFGFTVLPAVLLAVSLPAVLLYRRLAAAHTREENDAS